MALFALFGAFLGVSWAYKAPLDLHTGGSSIHEPIGILIAFFPRMLKIQVSCLRS
jgi:hypothetical protein